MPFNITGSNRSDTIYGGGGNDTVNANEGNDLLDGGAGNDNLRGHAGDDTLLGGVGDDLLHGFEGADILDGGGGNDALHGAAGNDTYRFGRDAGADTINDSDAAAGNLDSVTLAADVAPGAVSLHRHGNDLILSIDESTTQLTVINHFVATTLLNGIPVSDYNLVEQIAFADGTVWDKVAIAQRAIGGPPTAMVGSPGHDTFVVDNTLDTVTESPNQGADTIHSSVSYTLPINVENLTLTGYLNLSATGNALDNVLTGNSGHNLLNGGTGADTLIGGAGDDRYTVDGDDTVVEAADAGTDWVTSAASYILPEHVENGSLRVDFFSGLTPTLRGNALDNILLGHANAATYLDGGAGADTMTGGISDDTYVVDDYGDTIVEEAPNGTDTVRSSISYTLGAWLENLVLTGSAAMHGTGNDLHNVLTGNSANNNLSGGLGADRLVGGAGDDTYDVDQAGDVVVESANAGADTVFSTSTYTLGANVEHLTLHGTAAIHGTGNSLGNVLTGNSASNTLTGGAGNDTLDGEMGADMLIGEAGDDLYIVDETGDSAIENANEGTDTVFSSVTYSLSGTHVERLTLSGTAAINGTGNSLDNSLTGNSGDNTLIGNGGNDILDGAGGNDILKGGTGGDVYRFGPGSGQDTISENSTSASQTDRVEINSQPLSLVFSRPGGTTQLLASLHGTTDTLTVLYWYSDTSRQTEVFQAADGRSLLHTQVEQLIQAMATFSANNGGISWSQAIQERPDDVQAVLAAYWQPAS
jgi:Ca2+-binding RTX toxin-like protein